jgi:hypothetical protein
MVEVQALSALAASPVGAVSASLPAPSADAQQALVQIAQTPDLTDSERTQLATAVAQIDAGVQSPALRQSLFTQVSGLGVYLRSSGSEGWPRWTVMTALRAYGLNINRTDTSQTEQAVAAQVEQNLNALAQQSRQVSLGQALARVQNATPTPAQPAVVISPSVRNVKLSSPAPAAATPPAAAAAAPAVNKLV